MYESFSGPLPVITTSILGSGVCCEGSGDSLARARCSYRQRASRRMLKSSSGVQDVLETRRAGRSGRSVGMLRRPVVEGAGAGEKCVKGVE